MDCVSWLAFLHLSGMFMEVGHLVVSSKPLNQCHLNGMQLSSLPVQLFHANHQPKTEMVQIIFWSFLVKGKWYPLSLFAKMFLVSWMFSGLGNVLLNDKSIYIYITYIYIYICLVSRLFESDDLLRPWSSSHPFTERYHQADLSMLALRVVTARVVTARVVAARVVTARVVTARVVTARVVTARVVTARVVTARVVTARVVTARVVPARVAAARVVAARVVAARVHVFIGSFMSPIKGRDQQ